MCYFSPDAKYTIAVSFGSWNVCSFRKVTGCTSLASGWMESLWHKMENQCSGNHEQNSIYEEAHMYKSTPLQLGKDHTCANAMGNPKIIESNPNSKCLNISRDKQRKYNRSWEAATLGASLSCKWFSRRWNSAAKWNAVCLHTVQVQKLAVDTSSKVWLCPCSESHSSYCTRPSVRVSFRREKKKKQWRGHPDRHLL